MIRHEVDGREFQEDDICLFARLQAADGVCTVNSSGAVDSQSCDHFFDGHAHVNAAESNKKRDVVCEAAARV